MQNTKILSALASFVLAFTLATPQQITLAEDQYLPDVENFAGESIPGGIKLTWNPVEGADSYTIYYGAQSISEDGASYENSVLLGNVSEYALEDLTPNITYYFATAADDSTGTHLGSYNYSEEISVVAGELTENPEESEEESSASEESEEEEHSASENLLEENEHTSASEPTADPESLPQSGPAATALALVSGAGAYFWRRFRK